MTNAKELFDRAITKLEFYVNISLKYVTDLEKRDAQAAQQELHQLNNEAQTTLNHLIDFTRIPYTKAYEISRSRHCFEPIPHNDRYDGAFQRLAAYLNQNGYRINVYAREFAPVTERISMGRAAQSTMHKTYTLNTNGGTLHPGRTIYDYMRAKYGPDYNFEMEETIESEMNVDVQASLLHDHLINDITNCGKTLLRELKGCLPKRDVYGRLIYLQFREEMNIFVDSIEYLKLYIAQAVFFINSNFEPWSPGYIEALKNLDSDVKYRLNVLASSLQHAFERTIGYKNYVCERNAAPIPQNQTHNTQPISTPIPPNPTVQQSPTDYSPPNLDAYILPQTANPAWISPQPITPTNTQPTSTWTSPPPAVEQGSPVFDTYTLPHTESPESTNQDAYLLPQTANTHPIPESNTNEFPIEEEHPPPQENSSQYISPRSVAYGSPTNTEYTHPSIQFSSQNYRTKYDKPIPTKGPITPIHNYHAEVTYKTSQGEDIRELPYDDTQNAAQPIPPTNYLTPTSTTSYIPPNVYSQSPIPQNKNCGHQTPSPTNQNPYPYKNEDKKLPPTQPQVTQPVTLPPTNPRPENQSPPISPPNNIFISPLPSVQNSSPPPTGTLPGIPVTAPPLVASQPTVRSPKPRELDDTNTPTVQNASPPPPTPQNVSPPPSTVVYTPPATVYQPPVSIRNPRKRGDTTTPVVSSYSPPPAQNTYTLPTATPQYVLPSVVVTPSSNTENQARVPNPRELGDTTTPTPLTGIQSNTSPESYSSTHYEKNQHKQTDWTATTYDNQQPQPPIYGNLNPDSDSQTQDDSFWGYRYDQETYNQSTKSTIISDSDTPMPETLGSANQVDNDQDVEIISNTNKHSSHTSSQHKQSDNDGDGDADVNVQTTETDTTDQNTTVLKVTDDDPNDGDDDATIVKETTTTRSYVSSVVSHFGEDSAPPQNATP